MPGHAGLGVTDDAEALALVVDLREDDFAIEGLGVGVIRRPL